MKLPFCSTCDYRFKWKELLFIFGPKKCPKCEINQFVTAKKKRQGAWISPLVIIFMFLGQTLFNIPLSGVITYGAILIVLALLVSPFTYEFTDKEEPLF